MSRQFFSIFGCLRRDAVGRVLLDVKRTEFDFDFFFFIRHFELFANVPERARRGKSDF